VRRAIAARIVVMLLAGAGAAPAEDPAEILRRTAETYRSLHSLELSGVLTTRITLSGSVYSVAWPLSLAQADSTVLPPDSPVPALPGLVRFGPAELRGPHGEPVSLMDAGLSAPKGWSQFDQIDQHVREIRSFTAETIEFGGQPTPCWLIEVRYEPGFPARALSGHPVRYWIDQSSHLVLRESFGHRVSPASEFAEFVFQATSLKRNEPPPSWALRTLPQLAGQERPEWTGRPAPEFTLSGLDGSQVSLAALRGKVVLLNFWATWCAPCKDEIPMIEKLAAEFRAEGLAAWGITNEPAGKARDWLDRNGRSLSTLVDEERRVFEDYEAEKIPVSVIVDRNGNIVSYRVGLSGESQLRATIRKALEVGSRKP
jgi:peroxiredoxin